MSVETVPMSRAETAIVGLWRITTKAVTDDRGIVREFFRSSEFAEHGIALGRSWEQVNMTWTRTGGIRGLHGENLTKLVGVAYGVAFGVYVDARPASRTRGAVVTARLEVGVQVLIPPGVCNGFQAVSEPGCQYLYCFDGEWSPGMSGVAMTPLDPALGIAWPIAPDPSLLSDKDARAPRLEELNLKGDNIDNG